jgi:hypothetical protein
MGFARMSVLFKTWVTGSEAKKGLSITILYEKDGTRPLAIAALSAALETNLLPEKVLALPGNEKLMLLANAAAKSLRARSGELGEVLATEYIAGEKAYPVFVRRLRYKDGQDLAMRGDDFLAFRKGKAGAVEVLKVESKARRALTRTVAKAALMGLNKYEGRPTPQSVAFVVMRLFEEDRDADAQLVKTALEQRLDIKQVEHFAFTASSNDPKTVLLAAHDDVPSTARREVVGLRLEEYHDFLAAVYKALHAKK